MLNSTFWRQKQQKTKNNVSQNIKKGPYNTRKVQINLHIHTVWSGSSLCMYKLAGYCIISTEFSDLDPGLFNKEFKMSGKVVELTKLWTYLLLMYLDRQAWANRLDPDQILILWSGSILFATNPAIKTRSHIQYNLNPVSILRKSISGRHWPVRVADGPMTARCGFT